MPGFNGNNFSNIELVVSIYKSANNVSNFILKN